MLCDDTIEFGNEVARAYRGIDRLYRSQRPEDVWGIVVLDLGDASDALVFRDLDDVRSAFADLARRATELKEVDRRRYYADLSTSALTLADWLQDEADAGIDRQVRGYFGAEPVAAALRDLDRLSVAIHDTLMSRGFAGDLHTAARAWEQEHLVSPDDLRRETWTLIEEAFERSSRHLELDLPSMPKVEILEDAPYNARCDYARNVIEINQGPSISRPYLKRLVMHEVVPGHCLQFHTRARAHREGWGGADGLLSTVKCAASPIFEGLADSGGWLLDWVGPEDVTASLIYRYQTGLCTVTAWGLHESGWTLEQARAFLAQHVLVGGPNWIEHRLAYIGARGRGAHIWSYWLGESRLRSVLRHANRPLARHTSEILYGRLHSLASLDATDWRLHA